MEAPELVTYNLGPVRQIPVGEGRQFIVGGRVIAVFRGRNGRLYATQASCPHQGGRLADGVVGREQIVCPMHSYRFDLTTGQPVGSDCAVLETYEVRVTGPAEIEVSIPA